MAQKLPKTQVSSHFLKFAFTLKIYLNLFFANRTQHAFVNSKSSKLKMWYLKSVINKQGGITLIDLTKKLDKDDPELVELFDWAKNYIYRKFLVGRNSEIELDESRVKDFEQILDAMFLPDQQINGLNYYVLFHHYYSIWFSLIKARSRFSEMYMFYQIAEMSLKKDERLIELVLEEQINNVGSLNKYIRNFSGTVGLYEKMYDSLRKNFKHSGYVINISPSNSQDRPAINITKSLEKLISICDLWDKRKLEKAKKLFRGDNFYLFMPMPSECEGFFAEIEKKTDSFISVRTQLLSDILSMPAEENKR